ncbi:integral membrane protein [Streptomyces albus]|uniref:Integral membrane protein n=1 Tax=Streptomyces albus (strain ATCC 21838 / DSM 41398 / FERM P-419 / JCM 4703 / NBRC 107858) TaxID=1081613 RepID=A0A0B5ELL9_STRA4|nr:integral membrane protein [Streptomyces albus]AOU76747.1 integral membrane protein [Streptomyces albus]AYN32527.1 integral membrane protein [Streptomyces albus]
MPAARAADTPARSAPGSAADTEAEGPRPGRLTAAAVLAALEGLALLVGGVYLLVRGLTGDPEDRSQAATGGVTLIVLALLPLIAARGLLRRRSWSRGPAIITQIMALPVAWTLLQADSATIPGGIALAVAAVAVLVLLVHADTTRALGIRGPGQAPEGEAGDGKRDGG